MENDDINVIKFALLFTIRALNKTPNKQLRLLNINKIKSIEEMERVLGKL